MTQSTVTPASAAPDTAPSWGRRDRTGPLLALAWIAVLLPWRSNWGVGLVLLALCFTAPGVLLLRALRIPARVVASFPVYVPAASTIVMLAAGVACDLLGPILGLADPLHGLATADAVLALCLVLWLIGLPAPTAARLPWADWLAEPSLIVALVLPALSALGALVLSNGHSAVVARVSIFLDLAVFLGCLLGAGRLTRRQLAALLFGCALAIEFSWSLRSQEIVGFDISTEYFIAQHTQSVGIWHTLHVNDAYGAMLSVGILPSILRSLTGLSVLTSFKALYPGYVALLPVAIFLLGERLLSRRFAVGAAGLLLSQAYFFQQMPELARQEVALLFFATMLAALVETRMGRGRQCGLVALLASGLVVSHYSSTYLAIPLIVIACVARLLIGRFRGISAIAAAWLVAGVMLIGGSALWYSAITRSTSNVSSFVTALDTHGIDILPTHGGLLSTYLNGNNVNTVSPHRLEQLAVAEYRKTARYIQPLAAAKDRRYALQSATVPAKPRRVPELSSLITVFVAIYNELLLVAIAFGTVIMVLRRRASRTAAAVGLLALGAFAFLIFIRFSATAAAQYNQTRALAQSLIILALPAAWLIERLTTRITRRLRAFIWPLLSVAVALMFAQQSGALAVVLGGGTSLNIAASGEDYQRYYATPAEYAGARFADRRSYRTILYADRYGQLRIDAVSGRAVLTNVMPQTLDQYAWLYASRTNVQLHTARAQVNSDFGVYRWPSDFIDRYFDLVYDNGDSKVFHG